MRKFFCLTEFDDGTYAVYTKDLIEMSGYLRLRDANILFDTFAATSKPGNRCYITGCSYDLGKLSFTIVELLV